MKVKVLTVKSGATKVMHSETLKDASANNLREDAAAAWDEMMAKLLNPLVIGLGGTPFAGMGYAEKFVIDHSGKTDAKKSALMSGNRPSAQSKALAARAERLAHRVRS